MADQFPTKQNFYDAEKDLRTVSAVSNSRNPDTGAEIDTWETRSGGQTDTIAGRLKKLGVERIGDFTAGCTVTERNQGVLEVGGSVYVWLGALPVGGKVVPPGSTPGSTGGIGSTGWLDVGDAGATSRVLDRLNDADGSSLIGGLIKPVTAFYFFSDGGDYSKAVTRGFLSEKALYFPHRPDNTPWACNTTFTIPSNCALILDRCDLKTDVYINLIEQNDTDEWSLTANGVCRIIGPRIGSVGEPASIGLNMIDCYRPTFGANGALIFQDWSDRGWKASSTEFTGNPSFGMVSNVICRNNGVGWDLGDGNGCEYWSLSNLRSFSNMHGGYCRSPNSVFVNGGCTHNVINGLHHFNGFNDGHSSYTNFNFNHNGTNNLYLLGINSGLSFNGCQIFDDGAGTNTGKIRIEGCKGITINGGEINADIEVIGACAANTISNAYFTNDTRAYSISGTGRAGLFLMNCSNPRGSGAFPFNDNTFNYTVGYVGVGQTGQIPVATPTTIKVTPVTAKTVGTQSYDEPTGRWVARSAGRHTLNVYVDLGGTGAGAGNYVLIKLNGTAYMYAPCFTLSPSDVFCNVVAEFENLSVGDYVEVQAFIPAGTIAPRSRTRISMRLM